MWKRRAVLQDQAGGDGGGGGAAAPAPAPAAAPAAAAPAPAAPGAPGAAAAAPAPSALAAAASDPLGFVPEKYRTFKADDPKALDVDATLRKVSDGYQALAKRLGTGDAPPAAHTEYKVAPPDALKDAFKADDPAFAGFLEQAHKAGFTQAQLDVAMAGFFATAPKLVAGAQQLDTDACVAELRKEWTEPAAYQQNMTAAMRALRAYGGDAQVDALVGRFGNDPVALKLLAAVGRDIREDRPPQGGSTSGAHEIEALMKSEAYTNPKHAEHAMVSAQVKAHFDRMAGTGAPLQ